MSRPQPRLKWKRPPQSLRRGAALYVAVTGTTMIVSVLALSAMAIVRIERQQAVSTNERQIARSHARSGVELALQRINTDPSWRTTYTNGVETAAQSIGSAGAGTVSWKLRDTDGNLANSDGVLRLKGIGRIGSTVQVSSVVIRAGETTGVLRKHEIVTSGVYDDGQTGQLRQNGWWAQYFKPTALPAGANGWRITSVAVRAVRNVGNQLFSVRLYRVSGGNVTLLEAAEGLNSNSVPTTFGWYTIPFAGTTPLEVGDGVYLALYTTSSSPIRLSFDHDVDSPDNVNSALARDRSSIDAEEFASDEALQYRIDGAYTTSNDVQPVAGTWDWDVP